MNKAHHRSITKSWLLFAGWLAIAELLLIFAYGLSGFLIKRKEFPPVEQIIFGIISTSVFVFLFHTLKKFLNQRHNSYEANSYITTLIIITVTGLIFQIAHHIGCIAEDNFEIIKKIIAIISGGAFVLLGAKILSFSLKLCGLRKAFAWTSIIGGICTCIGSLTLPMIIGMLFLTAEGFVSIARQLILGIIFIRVASEI